MGFGSGLPEYSPRGNDVEIRIMTSLARAQRVSRVLSWAGAARRPTNFAYHSLTTIRFLSAVHVIKLRFRNLLTGYVPCKGQKAIKFATISGGLMISFSQDFITMRTKDLAAGKGKSQMHGFGFQFLFTPILLSSDDDSIPSRRGYNSTGMHLDSRYWLSAP